MQTSILLILGGLMNVDVMITMAIALLPMIRSGGTLLDRSEGFCLLPGYGMYLYRLWPK